ncbi:MAG: UDP-N-acetylmuramoyl-tripeptide--D-alanyl-D-alanine ligase [Desulfovibrionaceae bacterium]|nr:UDP-N-acetylmuramoyl-tripeptide--D-alanyl-D-alanine ligase [Desulfovibrionaceae bacterium]
MKIQELAHILNGKYDENQANIELDIRGAVIDSRKAFQGSLFFCICGAVVDGHEYIDSACEKGAILAIVEKEVFSPLPYILVDNVVEALGNLARYKRTLYSNVVIAITGSSGKTTAKEIISHVLESEGIVSKNLLNQNNQIGMPLAILNADIDACAWVLELGISEAHDMSQLGDIAQPNLVYITNAGNAHIQGLGDKGVAYHKASLLKYVKKEKSFFLGRVVNQAVFIPESEQNLIQEAIQYDIVLHRVNSKRPVTIEYQGIEQNSTYGIFTISYENHISTITMPYRGYFMQETLACVFEIAHYLGIPYSSICTRLTTLPSLSQRNSVRRYENTYVIDDTYNANPISMRAMIESAYSYPVEHYILVLGDMRELGELTEEEHYSLGAYIAYKSKTAKTSVLWKGIYSDYVKQGLESSNYNGEYYTNPSRDILKNILQKDTTSVILCKGSRSIALEEEVQEIYSILGVVDCDI